MQNPRIYGNSPYRVAVVHGGPGAPGSFAPVARELSIVCGVLEPLQTHNTLNGQVEELRGILEEFGDLPVILIGWSHGSLLSSLLTSRYPNLVKKLIIIGTVPFEENVAAKVGDDRLLRLSEVDRAEVLSLEEFIWGSVEEDKSPFMAKLFRIFTKAESYDLLPCEDEVIEYQLDINISVGLDSRRLLASGNLPEIMRGIKSPVTAIQGDFDLRPADSIRESLSRILKNFRFIQLEKCGHYPWYEKYARDVFYAILKEEILD